MKIFIFAFFLVTASCLGGLPVGFADETAAETTDEKTDTAADDTAAEKTDAAEGEKTDTAADDTAAEKTDETAAEKTDKAAAETTDETSAEKTDESAKDAKAEKPAADESSLITEEDVETLGEFEQDLARIFEESMNTDTPADDTDDTPTPTRTSPDRTAEQKAEQERQQQLARERGAAQKEAARKKREAEAAERRRRTEEDRLRTAEEKRARQQKLEQNTAQLKAEIKNITQHTRDLQLRLNEAPRWITPTETEKWQKGLFDKFMYNDKTQAYNIRLDSKDHGPFKTLNNAELTGLDSKDITSSFMKTYKLSSFNHDLLRPMRNQQDFIEAYHTLSTGEVQIRTHYGIRNYHILQPNPPIFSPKFSKKDAFHYSGRRFVTLKPWQIDKDLKNCSYERLHASILSPTNKEDKAQLNVKAVGANTQQQQNCRNYQHPLLRALALQMPLREIHYLLAHSIRNASENSNANAKEKTNAKANKNTISGLDGDPFELALKNYKTRSAAEIKKPHHDHIPHYYDVFRLLAMAGLQTSKSSSLGPLVNTLIEELIEVEWKKFEKDRGYDKDLSRQLRLKVHILADAGANLKNCCAPRRILLGDLDQYIKELKSIMDYASYLCWPKMAFRAYQQGVELNASHAILSFKTPYIDYTNTMRCLKPRHASRHATNTRFDFDASADYIDQTVKAEHKTEANPRRLIDRVKAAIDRDPLVNKIKKWFNQEKEEAE